MAAVHTDEDGLAAPAGNTHSVHRPLTIMSGQRIDSEKLYYPESTCTVSWKAEVYAYPTGASLEDSNAEYWKSHGQVHIVVVHRGAIEYAFPNLVAHATKPQEHTFTFSMGIENKGAQARVQFPANNSGVESGYDTHYKTRFSKKMPMYNGATPLDFTAVSEKAFTLSNCKQESAVTENMAEMKLLSTWTTSTVQKQEIYGLSHFTLDVGDYEDLHLTFAFNETWKYLPQRNALSACKFEVFKLDFISGISPSPEEQAAATATTMAAFKAATDALIHF